MTTKERIRWCIANAEEIEATLGPQAHPHEWDTPRLCAQFWRELARRMLIAEAA